LLLIDSEGFGMEELKKELKSFNICEFHHEDVFLLVKNAMEVTQFKLS
jgi:hypothetical protein